DHRLGRLALLRGDVTEARARLRAAVEQHERWGARPMLAYSLAALATAAEPAERAALQARAREIAQTLGLALLLARLGAEAAPGASRTAYFAGGATWQIGLDEPKPLPARRGFPYIARLLRTPGAEIDALELGGGPETVQQS